MSYLIRKIDKIIRLPLTIKSILLIQINETIPGYYIRYFFNLV